LNPVEVLFSWLNMNPIANRFIHDIEPLDAVTRRSARFFIKQLKPAPLHDSP